jgi:purine-binding chemotaxis protein CheW
MSRALAMRNETAGSVMPRSKTQHEFVTMRLNGQLFGISVMAVQDVLRQLTISPVPLTPPVIAGLMNIRGRIVTGIDMRVRLNMPSRAEEDTSKLMFVVVEFQHELFSLIVDGVGDVLNLPMAQLEKTPPNMDDAWRSVSGGVFKLEKEIMVVLDVANIIEGIRV